MKKKQQSPLKKFRSLIIGLAVLTLFALPAVASLQWAKGVLGLDSTRKTIDAGEFQPRPYDIQNGAIKPFDEPIISVTFDDGWETAYTVGLPVMQEYGILSTQYVLGSTFDDPSYVSEGQIQSFMSAGHEIASHSMTHPNLTSLSDEQLRYELGESKKVLSSKFPITEDFAPPVGAYDERTTSFIKQYYRSARNTEADLKNGVFDSDANLGGNFDRYNINAFTMRSSTTLEDLRQFIAFAQENNAWIIITYHQLDSSGTDYSVSPENFRQQMQLISESKIRSAPLGKVIDAIDGKSYVPQY